VKCKTMAVLVHRYTRDEERLESQKCLVEEERKSKKAEFFLMNQAFL